jgi:transcriptional regulator with XRE-family HTH domain
MEKTQSKFGEVLTRLMKAAGMKPLDVSARLVLRRVPVIPQTVDNWCKGKSEPRASHVRALAEIFGIPVAELLEDNERTE